MEENSTAIVVGGVNDASAVINDYNRKLKYHFDNYIKSLAISKQMQQMKTLDDIVKSVDKQLEVLDNNEYYDHAVQDNNTQLAIMSSEVDDEYPIINKDANPYFITQKDEF